MLPEAPASFEKAVIRNRGKPAKFTPKLDKSVKTPTPP